MRFSFANGEHADFVLQGGAVDLGSAEGNALLLPGRDVAGAHARVTLDARGAVLEVLDAHAQTHLNARPVREKALLRCGDVLCLGRVSITLKADRDDLIETALPPPVESSGAALRPSRVLLRGVAGSHFGKTVAVAKGLVIGRKADCDLVIDEARIAARQVLIETAGHAIYLREIDEVGGVRVNGIAVRNAVLHPGDQITLGGNQFLVEAPGFPLRGEQPAADARAITDRFRAVDDVAAPKAPGQGQGGIWWLIGAAAVIALAFALLIHRGV